MGKSLKKWGIVGKGREKVGGGGGGCVADENIIFPKTYVSREYNNGVGDHDDDTILVDTEMHLVEETVVNCKTRVT